MISSFILSYSFSTLFIKTNSSWPIFESIKALEIKTSILLNLGFTKNVILTCLCFFFLITNLYFLIPTVTAQIFMKIAELVIPIGIPTKKEKAEMEKHSSNCRN